MNKKHHLVIVIESLGGGGAQKAAINIAKRWSNEGLQVSFVLFSQSSDIYFSPPTGANISFLDSNSTSSSRGLTANIRRILLLRKALDALKPDVVLTMVSTTNTIGCLASIGAKWRLVISERNDPTRQNIGRFWHVARTLAYPIADLITANSRVALKFLAKRHKPEKLLYVPNIIALNGEDTQITPTHNSYLKMLAVGRLHVQKRYDVLLDALEIVRKTTDAFHLSVLGDGPLEPELKQKCSALNLEKHVTWLGFQIDTDAFYRTHHIFVLASDYEGSSNALLEGMTFGLAPVVADSQEGSLQYVKDGKNGSVFQQGDATSLAHSILKYYQDKELLNEHRKKALTTSKSLQKQDAFEIWKSALIGEKLS